jgi:hypothetical protein
LDFSGSREAVLGADELTDLAVRFRSRDGDVYALFGVVRYGDQWWLSELGARSPFCSTSA